MSATEQLAQAVPERATAHHCPPDRRKYVLIVAILASAMGFIDGSVVAVAIPQMRASLDASFTQAQWIANSYILTLAALIMIGGAAGDRFGMRRTFGFGVAAFTVFSLFCALAWSANSLIGFRAFQGAGAAIMIPGSMALIALNFPKEERGRALGIWVAGSSVTTALGPLVGGVLLTYGGPEAWRWIFAFNLPVGLLVLALLFQKVPPSRLRDRSQSIDYVGAVLLAATLATFAVGLSYLGETEEIRFGLALIMVGLALCVVTVLWEHRVQDPMINPALFRSAAFSGANALTFLVWAGFSAIIFFLPMVLIVAWNLPPTYAGGLFLPFSALIAVISPLAGRLADRFGVRILLTIGPAIVAVSYLVLAWAVAEQNYWYGVLSAIIVMGVGIGLCASPVSVAAVSAVSDDDAGTASGTNNMFARMSNLFAIAGLGAGVAYAYGLIVRGSSLPTEIQALMIEAGFGERLTGALYQVSTVELHAVAMNHAMIALCLVTAALSVFGGLIGWFTQPSHQRLTS
ncbi:MAG: DHA2 family efflux MFS transporter permease subunit [Ahrensia sp.]|nr:DHA2 family efflux MFS transporter permease subunit [Ahrensia sp.]